MGLFSRSKKAKYETFLVPMTGEVKAISETPDEAFSQKMMGDGVVIFPTVGELYAPVDATVEFVFPTKHAIGFRSVSGTEFLVHVGIDTVKLEGKCFEVLVEAGQSVKAGDLLMRFDLEFIAANAKSIATPVVITNLEDKTLEVVASGQTSANQELLHIK